MNLVRNHQFESSCPVCKQQSLRTFFEAEHVPIHCNVFWSKREDAVNAPRGDIHLGFCSACTLIYNLAFDNGCLQYSAEYETYETSLQFSPHFENYARQLAGRLIKNYDLNGKEIIEIGCGQGEFLSLLCEGRCNRGVGFDPGYDSEKTDASRTSDITFVQDFYTEAYGNYHADFICCRHVLEHVPTPRNFLSQVRRAIGRKMTAVYFEVPNALYTLRGPGVWDIIYEHCSYFTPSSLSRLFTEAGFTVLRVYEAYGGQFLCIEAVPEDVQAHRKSSPPSDTSEVGQLIPAFADSYQKKVKDWSKTLMGSMESRNRVALWGAGAKGVTFLNSIRGGHDQIGCVIDMNPRKQGRYVPGTGQRIASPKELIQFQPDLIIMMNTIYQDEIHHMTRDMNVDSQLLAA